MSNTPFKLKSQGSSFKMMGSSPAKHPLEEEHTHPEETKKETEKPEVTMNVMNPDVMNIIKKRKQFGPQESKESQQKEITKLVEERESTKTFTPKTPKKKTKIKAKNKPVQQYIPKKTTKKILISPELEKKLKETQEKKVVKTEKPFSKKLPEMILGPIYQMYKHLKPK
jgi:hypothetical protein